MLTLLAFLFVLGVLIFVHEFGHFVVARLYGVRVLTFSLGFGPKLVKMTRGDTEYCISAVPIGGYVKLAGETVEDTRTGAPDEFLSKSRWVRFQVYLAGPVMNLLLAFFLLAGVLAYGADEPLYETSPPVVGTLAGNSPAARAGLQPGDRILQIGDTNVSTWNDLDMAVLPAANRELSIAVLRGGQRLELHVTPEAVGKFEIGSLGIAPVFRPQFLDTTPGYPAAKAGFQRGDIVLAVNGKRLDQPDIIKLIQKSGGTPLTFTIQRGDAIRGITVTPEGGSVAIIGAHISPWEFRRVDPTFPQALVLSAQENWASTVLIVKTIKGLFSAQTPVRQLMGPVAIAQLSGEAAALGWMSLFSLMVMISLNLGLLNLMPIPVLDGGHITILAVEGLFRRDLSIKVKERILLAGAALIVLLLVTVLYNDVMRLMR